MRRFGPGLAIAVALGPATAVGSDGNLPRTPVLHVDAPCLTVVDKREQPTLHLDYTVPFADTCVGPDEAPHSRTHQFVAVCRSPEPPARLPSWIATADVDAALAAGSLTPDLRPAADEVFETASAWDGCWHRIVADGERRSIDCETALRGVDWDLETVPAGAYLVYGYTYHPPTNMWQPRAGVVKVRDGTQDPPAVAVRPHAPYLGDDAPLGLTACVDAPPGSIVTGSLALASDDGATWMVGAMQEIAGPGEVELAIPAPTGLAAVTPLWLHVEVTAPDGQRFRYVSPHELSYVPGPAPPWNPAPDYDYCREADDATEPQMCPMTEPDDPSPSDEGCACAFGAPPSSAWWALGVLLGVALGRPRRAHVAAAQSRGAGPLPGSMSP